MISFDLGLAGKTIRIHCLEERTKEYCKDFALENSKVPDFEVSISQEDLLKEKELECNKGSYGSIELSCLYRKIVTKLANDNILLFHCSAVEVNGCAYCFAARSGVGKSTHVRLLFKALGDKIHYINDDKPLLRFTDDGIEVYGTPWNGKERKSANVFYPLKGIALLSRSPTNSIELIDSKTAYKRIVEQIYLPSSKAELIQVLGMIDKLLTSTPIFDLKANMEIEAALTSYKGMMERN